MTGVGCSAEAGAGPTLPRSAAGALAERLGRDVSWAAIGEAGAAGDRVRAPSGPPNCDEPVDPEFV